jgi:hypothetical protein
MTSEETALREAGFGVDHGGIVDLSGQCPGFATLPSFNHGVVNRTPRGRRSFGNARPKSSDELPSMNRGTISTHSDTKR